jgi:hypothetical protein
MPRAHPPCTKPPAILQLCKDNCAAIMVCSVGLETNITLVRIAGDLSHRKRDGRPCHSSGGQPEHRKAYDRKRDRNCSPNRNSCRCAGHRRGWRPRFKLLREICACWRECPCFRAVLARTRALGERHWVRTYTRRQVYRGERAVSARVCPRTDRSCAGNKRIGRQQPQTNSQRHPLRAPVGRCIRCGPSCTRRICASRLRFALPCRAP